MDKGLIKVVSNKVNGFKKTKFTMTAYVDDKGQQIVDEPKEGTEVITIEVSAFADNFKQVENKLVNEIEKEVKKIRPLYIM